MFEDEVKDILEKYENSQNYKRELEELQKKYESVNTYSLYIRYDDTYNRAVESLNHLLSNIDVQYLVNPVQYKAQYPTLEEIAEKVKRVSRDDLFYNIAYYQPYHLNKTYYGKPIELGNNEYKEENVYYNKLYLITSALWLLNHDSLYDENVKQAIYKKHESGEPFIFNTCKITHFKNRNLKIQFSDVELFKKFSDNFNKALKQAEKAYNKRNKEA